MFSYPIRSPFICSVSSVTQLNRFFGIKERGRRLIRLVYLKMLDTKVENLLKQLNNERNYTVTRYLYEIPLEQEMLVMDCFINKNANNERAIVCLINGKNLTFPDFASGENFNLQFTPGFAEYTFYRYLKQLLEVPEGQTFMCLKETKTRNYSDNVPVQHRERQPQIALSYRKNNKQV